MSKRIVYLRTDIGAHQLNAGGSVAHTLGVIEGFRAQGYQVSVGSSAMIALLQKQELPLLTILCMPRVVTWLGYKISCLLSNIVFTFQARTLLRSAAPQALYQRYSMLNMTGLVLSWWYRVPLILEYNGSEAWIDAQWSPRKLVKLSWLVYWVERTNLTYADTIIVVSEVLKEQLCSAGIDSRKIAVIPNGVNTAQYDPSRYAHERLSLRTSLQVEQAFVVGFIGTFSYWHGIELLAHVIPLAVRRNRAIKFLLIGSGPLQGWLQQQLDNARVHDAVRFTGTIAQDQAPAYLAACDAYVCPTQTNADGTRFFGSPTKLFEYMSMGKPILASRLEQLEYLLQPCLYAHELEQRYPQALAITAHPHSVIEWVNALCWLAQADPELRIMLGANARARALQAHSWTEHVNHIIQAYTHVRRAAHVLK